MARLETPEEITLWLHEREVEDDEAIDELFVALYDELKKRAHSALRRAGHWSTVDTTSLVNEAYLRLIGSGPFGLKDRRHFMALVARTMRWVLMDTARARKRQRRGGDKVQVSFEEALVMSETRADELLALDQALERLGEADRRLEEVVEHRFFGGLSLEEIAATLEVSTRTVKRDLQKARAYLAIQLRSSADQALAGLS